MKLVENSLFWLGAQVKDKFTSFEGTISSISFDISGCIQGFVRPYDLKDGKMQDGYWLDLSRLKVLDTGLIDKPNFHGIELPENANGPEDKSDPSLGSNK